jgi:predicted  nucleic acid-binding Zn-ribbon protein
MAKKISAAKAAELEKEAQMQESMRLQEVDIIVENRLVALCALQTVDSQIDKIRIIRGELPLEVRDLEDEIAGLQTRISNLQSEISGAEKAVVDYKNAIEEHKELIKKYTKQQENVRNNREFESLNKEIEFQNLEIQLCERKIKDSIAKGKERHQQVEIAKNLLSTRQGDLDAKKIELEEITKETEIEEVALQEKSKELEQAIDERYLKAYKRIRLAARNGLAVVGVDRDACGGCFNKIPHQRQMEIKMHKKVIVCEHCGRILIDEDIREKSEERIR